MVPYVHAHNIVIDGDEFTSGLLGLDWFPSKQSSTAKSNYELGVVTSLNTIFSTRSGNAVINEIRARKQFTMRISPYHPDPVNGTCNATASPTDLEGATLKDTTALDPNGNLPPPGAPKVVGTGTGSNSVVHFSASTWAPGAGCAGGPGATADEILLHEMVHGLRQMMGRSIRETVVGNPGMQNYEEFVAILVTNIYRSERKIPGLRSDHTGFTLLASPDTNPAVFKTKYSRYLSDFGIEQPALEKELQGVKVPFNPI